MVIKFFYIGQEILTCINSAVTGKSYFMLVFLFLIVKVTISSLKNMIYKTECNIGIQNSGGCTLLLKSELLVFDKYYISVKLFCL